MLKSIQNWSVIKQILVIVLVPTLSYFMMSGMGILGALQQRNQASNLLAAQKSYSSAIQDYIFLITEERKAFWDYALTGSGESVELFNAYREDKVKKGNELKGNKLPKYYDIKLHKDAMDEMEKLIELSPKLDNSIDFDALNMSYGRLITKLLTLKGSIANNTTPEIGSRIISIVLISESVENASQLSFEMLRILQKNDALPEAQLQKILDIMAKVKAGFFSEALNLTEDSKAILEMASSTEHWQSLNSIFNTIITKADTGKYDLNSDTVKENFETAIGELRIIEIMEQEQVDAAIADLRKKNEGKLWRESIGVLINSLFILLVLIPVLRSIRRKLKQISEKVMEASTGISFASEKLSNNSEVLTSGSLRTGEALDRTMDSMKEIQTGIHSVLDKVDGTKVTAEKVKEKVKQGTEAVQNLGNSMGAIKQSTEGLQEILKIMDRISEQTNEVHDIVFQTKLLSFNAAIEAELAGESGRGFSIVASEVGLLAKQSGESAENIRQLLIESKKTVNQILGTAAKTVDEGVEKNDSVSAIINEINAEMDSILYVAEQSLQSGKQQEQSIQEVSHTLNSVGESAKENKVQSEDIDVRTGDLIDQSSNLKAVTEDLKKLISGKAA